MNHAFISRDVTSNASGVGKQLRLAFLFAELLAAFACRVADPTQNFDPSKMDKIWLADRYQKEGVTTLKVDLLDLDTISANPCSLVVYQGQI